MIHPPGGILYLCAIDMNANHDNATVGMNATAVISGAILNRSANARKPRETSRFCENLEVFS